MTERTGNIRPVLLLVALCAALYLPWLGAGGLTYTEGHRVIPAWEMLDSGDWLVPRLFDRPYLRKPPGMQWAVAASSMVFGRTEFAARLASAVCATGMVLAAYAFARTWFGRRGALLAGAAQALAPMFWEADRSAEIEALNNLCVQLAVLAGIHVLIGRGRRPWAPLVLALALFGMVMAKGPAGAPVVVSSWLAACVVASSLRPLLRAPFLSAVFTGVVLSGVVLAGIAWRLSRLDAEPVTQGVGEFMWSLDRLPRILALAPTGLLYALPVSLALLPPFSRRPLVAPAGDARPRAQALALSCLLSLVVYTLLGIDNPRYLQPAFAPIAPLAGFFFATRVTPPRRVLARMLASPALWGAVLVVAFAGFIAGYENPRRATSSELAAESLARAIPRSAELWADQVVESRPETLYYAARDTGATVRWRSQRQVELALASGRLCVLRTDAPPESDLLERFDVELLYEGKGHKFTFALVRRRDAE